jgi:Flp pilus assembly protein TadG
MLLTRLRRGRSGQAIVIMALAMVAICGMLALAIDTGRLYFQRRLMQDAVDAGSLAGAQSLVGTVSNPIGQPNYALYYALDDTFSVFGQNPANNDPTSSFYTAPVNNTVTDTEGGYTVTAVAPTGYNNKQVKVTVSYNAIATFVQVLGFNSIGIIATATAEAGTNAKTYAIFAYGGIGTGNTINIQGGGYGQVDNGQDGTDVCSATPSGETISNAKIHVPAGYPGVININGNIYINQANDNQHMAKYWVLQPPFASGQDPEPNYLIPDTSQIAPLNPGRSGKLTINQGNSGTLGGITLHNSTSSNHDFFVYHPGKYTNSIVIPQAGDDPNSMYIFANGIYLFTSGASLVTHGSNISNTTTGLAHYVGGVGATNLPPAADGTDGVEFVFDNGSYYSADNTSSANAGSVFFVAPSFVPTGSTHVAFYIASTNGYANPWSETFNAQASNTPRYQIWGSVFDSSANGGTQGGTGMTLTGVELGPHNMSPADDTNPGSAGSAGQYAVTGEFIGFTLTIDDGAVQGNTSGGPASCPAGITAGHPALLVQYNKNFAPAPGVNSFLVR